MPEPPTILLLLSVLLLLGSVFFLPRVGIYARLRAEASAARRRQMEDALKILCNMEQEGAVATLHALASSLNLSNGRLTGLVQEMAAQGLVQERQASLSLTPEGRRLGLQVIRAHRLWERYLADEARLPLQSIHSLAHRREHGMTPRQINDLDAALGHPSRDPHGDPIPDAAGRLRVDAPAAHFSDWQPGLRARILHLEDEPPVAYAQLLAAGLRVGQTVTILENKPERVVLSDGEREIVLAPAIAANVSLQALEASQAVRQDLTPLSALRPRAQAEIVELDPRCQGFTRRRFLDLGLTPGTRITPELENAFKEPRAYRVRGTLVALRNDQADLIWVRQTA